MLTSSSAMDPTEVADHDDVPVVMRILAGDRESFAQLARRYNQRLFRVVRSILHSDPEAEDAVQQAYVSAYLNLRQFDGNSKFSTWITRIAINEAYALIRASKRAAAVAVDAPSSQWLAGAREASSPEQQFSTRELSKCLEAAIESLPESYRVPLLLREVEGLSTSETAECLGLSEEAIRVRIHRARALLKDVLLDDTGMAFADLFVFGGLRCDRMVRHVLAAIAALEN